MNTKGIILYVELDGGIAYKSLYGYTHFNYVIPLSIAKDVILPIIEKNLLSPETLVQTEQFVKMEMKLKEKDLFAQKQKRNYNFHTKLSRILAIITISELTITINWRDTDMAKDEINLARLKRMFCSEEFFNLWELVVQK
jgi:hypothetical protein